jgi:gluconate kinase
VRKSDRPENTSSPLLFHEILRVDLFDDRAVSFAGSGKSTWSRKLQQVMPWKYERVNQDELKTRSQCLSKAQQVLWTEKKCAIVDRCHVSREQRAYFVKLAQSSNVNSQKSRDVDFATATTTSTTTPLSKIPVDCIFFDVSKDTCLARCRQRRNHPTLPASKAAFVLNAMEKELEIPTIREGFRNIHRIQDEHTFLQVLNTYLSMPSSLQSS